MHRSLSPTLFALLLCKAASAQAGVTVDFDADGLRSIRLADQEQLVGGNVLPTTVRAADGKILRGKADKSEFDRATLTRISTHPWGRVTTRYEVLADGLRLHVTIANTSETPITQFVASLATIVGEDDAQRISPLATTVMGPAVVTAVGAKSVFASALDAGTKPASLDLFRQADPKSGTSNLTLRVTLGGDRVIADNVLADRPIAAGATDSFAATLRFADAGTDPVLLVKDTIDAYRATRPAIVNWPDRRPVLRLFFGGGLPVAAATENLKNPDAVVAPAPDAKFREQILARMKGAVAAAKATDAQAVILWDLEGGSYPHPTTYIGDPRLIRVLNPQMDLVADDAIKLLKDAGLHVGVTLRPSRVVYSPEKATAAHSHTAAEDPYRELEAKVEYAKKRWGCRIFYVDTNFFWRPYGVDKKWQSGQLTADVWQRLQTKYPDTLFVPEFGSVADFQATAPYGEADMGDYGTPALPRAIWPDAFRVIVVEDADPYDNYDRFVAAVRGRNALMTYAFAPESANAVAIKRIYTEAKLLDEPAPDAVAKADAAQLVRIVETGDTAARFHAARRLLTLDGVPNGEALLRVGGDETQEWVVRRAAMMALAKSPGESQLPTLIPLLTTRTTGLYAAARSAIAANGQPAVDALMKHLAKIATQPSADAWSIEQIGLALRALKASNQAAGIRAIIDTVPEGKSQIATRKALLFVLARLDVPDQADYFSTLLQDPHLYEPAALALVLSKSPVGLAQVRSALDAAKSANDPQKTAVLTRVLRSK